ncbi:response regulator transcription factor [candidate division KSB1 bacterium]|nr:response regulator transcription factor [candidate division KSB1 bacterium]
MVKVLMIKKDEPVLQGLKDDLITEGYQVTMTRDGSLGFQYARRNAFDIIILDLLLPRLSGLKICRQLRGGGIRTPIILLAAHNQETEKIRGLELGADDYVTRPFKQRELFARMKAILRRANFHNNLISRLHFGDITIDFSEFMVTKAGKTLLLTNFEFNLLKLLVFHPDEVLSHTFILEQIWGNPIQFPPRTLDRHVSLLRKKVEDDPAHPKYILGVGSKGYKFQVAC